MVAERFYREATATDRAPLLRIVVIGEPGPQGSKRYMGQTQQGYAKMVESSRKVKPWREVVTNTAFDLVHDPERHRLLAGYPLDEPLIARIIFTFVRPQSHYRTGATTSHLLRGGAPEAPSGKPDVSKLLRSTEDALTAAGVWRDDARVVDYRRAAKVYAGEDPDALDVAGALIEIYRRLPGIQRREQAAEGGALW
jgi:Holliday junction resolvase RusA-like endonuclease